MGVGFDSRHISHQEASTTEQIVSRILVPLCLADTFLAVSTGPISMVLADSPTCLKIIARLFRQRDLVMGWIFQLCFQVVWM